MSEPTADELARWAEEHRPVSWGLCGYCEDEEWPCSVTRLLALVAAQAEQIAELRDGMFGWRKHYYDAWAERDASEAKIERVRAACDEADRRGLGTDHIRAALDGTEGDA